MVVAGLGLPWLVFFVPRLRDVGGMLLGRPCLGAAGICLSGCGNRIYSYSTTAAATKSYAVTVTATGTSASGASLTHAGVVKLVVE